MLFFGNSPEKVFKTCFIMPIVFYIVAILGAYILGSIPTAVWVGKFFYGLDVREHGSGNAGATNTFRVLGVKAGIPVLLIDIFKGWAAVKLIYFFQYFAPGSVPYINFELMLGVAAVLGHIFPVFAGFNGGKGVATLSGVALAVHPFAALLTLGVFVVILLSSRYVSLSSILAGIAFPIFILVVFKVDVPSLAIFSIAISVLLIVTHQKNIERLLKREESRANIFGKRKKNKPDE